MQTPPHPDCTRCSGSCCSICGETKGGIMGMGSGRGAQFICFPCIDKVLYFRGQANQSNGDVDE